MKTKTWKKAVLFSLVTSWSVFTTGCISPAIFRAILGLVEAIFNDVGGTGSNAGTPGRPGANTGLGGNNAGNTGINGTRNQPGTPNAPTAGTPTRPGNSIAGTDGDVNTGQTDGRNTGGGQPADANTQGVDNGIELARTRVSNHKLALTLAMSFVTNDVPACESIETARETAKGEINAEVTTLQLIDERIDRLRVANMSPTDKMPILTQILLEQDGIEQKLIGGAPEFSWDKERCRVWLVTMFDQMRTGIAMNDSMFGTWARLRTRARVECSR